MSLQSSRQVLAYYAQLITTIFDFMSASGLERKQILEAATQAIDCFSGRNNTRVDVQSRADLATVARVLDSWHRNRRYLNSNAEPKAVALLGPAPSVQALVRGEQVPHKEAAIIARKMRRLGLIASCGSRLYKPVAQSAVAPTLDALLHQHVVRASARLFQTVKQNVSRARTSERLVEKLAEIPDLPVEHIRDFQKFTHAQGGALLRTINDWLESRRIHVNADRRNSTVAAGLHVFAYVDSAKPTGKSRYAKRTTATR